MRRLAAFAVLLLEAGCTTLFPPKPAVTPVVRHAAPPDWFQNQLAEARKARQSHVPKDDTAGAEAAYDRVLRAACTRVALSGPQKYQARCATVLQQTAAPAPSADLFPCDPDSTDPAILRSCND